MMRNVRAVRTLLLVCSLFLSLCASQALAAPAKQSLLTPSDCAKCHATQPADIEANGSKHKTSVNCQSCHAGHRPDSKNNIPVCSQCHQGKPHFEQKNCMQCHKNPHTPLKVVFDTTVNGTYGGQITINSSDPVNPVTTADVTATKR